METKVKYKLNREKKMLFLQSTNITMPEIALGARDKMKTQKNTGTVLTKHSLRIILQTLSCFVKYILPWYYLHLCCPAVWDFLPTLDIYDFCSHEEAGLNNTVHLFYHFLEIESRFFPDFRFSYGLILPSMEIS